MDGREGGPPLRTGWGAFAAWYGIGALFGFALVALASIGLFVLWLAAAVAALLARSRRVRVWPEIAGALSGVGAFPFFVGLLNLGSTPCPSSGSASVAPGATAPTTCGGFGAEPWLLAGALLTLAGVALHVLGVRSGARHRLLRQERRGAAVKTLGVALFVVAAVLLLAMGGAIVAAPVTLPAMYVVVRRHPTRAFRTAGAIIGALTAAELAWAAVYLATGEATPAIWAVPIVGGLGAGYLIAR